MVVASTLSGTPEHRRDVERHFRERLRGTRMKLTGPGCCALMNPSLGLNVSAGLPMPVAGNVAFTAQSGAFHGRLSESAVYLRYFEVLKLARFGPNSTSGSPHLLRVGLIGCAGSSHVPSDRQHHD